MKKILAFILCILLVLACAAACADGGEPSSAGTGLMSYDAVLRLIRWIDDGYYKNKTYEEIVAFTGVEGKDCGHTDTSMTALGDHYFNWIADSDQTHYIHVCFRGRDDSGRFEACQWNTSGFRSEEWANADLTEWLAQTACHDTTGVSLDIQRFSNPVVTVTAQMPVTGWRTDVSSNTATFYNDRGEEYNDPRIEVETYDDPAMFDFYIDHYDNLQPAESRIIAGIEMKGRTYHTTGWDWTEYSAQLTEKVSIGIRISRVECGAGTEGGSLLDSLMFTWTEADGTEYAFPGSAPAVIAKEEPVPETTPEPTPEPTAAPAPTEAPKAELTDRFLPNDPVEFLPRAAERKASWQEYTFTNEINGVSIVFCMPMDEENAVSDFYEKNEPYYNTNEGAVFFTWRYDAVGKTKISFDISHLSRTPEDYEVRYLISHNPDPSRTFTTLKTDRGFTIYRRINDRGEYRWAFVSDDLSDGTRVLALVEANNKGTPGESWYEAIVEAFEGTVQLIIPGEELKPAATETPAATEAPATAAPAAETPAVSAPATPGNKASYVGTWYSTWLHTGGMDCDPRSTLGLTLILTLNEDGTGDLDYFGSDGGGVWGADEDGIVRYWGEGTPLSFLEDGSLCWGSYLSGYTLFSRDKTAEAKVFPADPSANLNDTPAAAAPQASSANGSAASGDYVGVKYVGKTYIAGGVTMDASVLGGEYAIVLNSDGTAVFTMAGMDMPGYEWQDAGDHIDVGAFGTVIMTLTMEADGNMMMDYSSAFTLLMEPQQ